MAAEARPAQPKAILRGHKTQVHAAAFCRRNERLLTGDADGFVVVWDLTIMRPRAVWQPHISTILGIAGWGDERIITHGRDNRLIVWKLSLDDEATLSTSLPLDPTPGTRPQPWMLHMLEINTMNFCTFSSCPVTADSATSSTELLVAVPNTLASEAIDIFHLPSQARRHTVKLGEKNGMVMALSLFHQGQHLTLVAGYENGHTLVAYHDGGGKWSITYRAQCHSQPVLSLDVSSDRTYFLTSSADDAIVKHPVPAVKLVAQQNTVEVSGINAGASPQPKKSLLSDILPQSTPSPSAPGMKMEIQSEPLKVVRTRHSGQQDLKIRSDGKIFATAGWDSKIRVYSAKTLKEVAVLKWHQVGCYATAFAAVGVGMGTESRQGPEAGEQEKANSPDFNADRQKRVDNAAIEVIPKLVEVRMRDKRIRDAKIVHWLAAGSKDGKVSLWDVF